MKLSFHGILSALRLIKEDHCHQYKESAVGQLIRSGISSGINKYDLYSVLKDTLN